MSPPRRRVAIVAVLVAGLAGFAVWRLVLAPPAVPPCVIAVSGRIEGDNSAVAAKTSGRIREITVREGDPVEAGQVIAELDDEQIRAREGQASAAVRQAEARVRLAQHQITVLNEQLQQSRFGVDQARADAQGRVSEAEGKLAAAEAQLAQAEAAHTQAKWDREAMGRLFKRELVAEQEARRAESARTPKRRWSRPPDVRSKRHAARSRRRRRICSTRPFAPPRSPRSRGSSCRPRRISPPRKPRPSAREPRSKRRAPTEKISASPRRSPGRWRRARRSRAR